MQPYRRARYTAESGLYATNTIMFRLAAAALGLRHHALYV
jgi:hypothetical protein